MQTIPSFVYLIPVVMLLGIGKVPGLIAVCIYAIPPIVRLTNLGIRLVDKEVLEAADAFGADYKQRLFGIQIPLALPNIFAGVNQTIMMSLAMVVIASMIGVKGLGVPVLRAISNQYLALGLLNGLAIVTLAIIFDRVSQEYGRRLQAHRQGADHDRQDQDQQPVQGIRQEPRRRHGACSQWRIQAGTCWTIMAMSWDCVTSTSTSPSAGYR